MAGCFSSSQFQNTAFSTDGGAAQVNPYPGAAGGVAGKKRKRTLVEIDGQTFEVRSVGEAQSLLAEARATAESVAARVAKTALNKARDVERKTGKFPTLEVAVPALQVAAGADPDIAALVIEAQRGVDEIYLRAAQAVELAWLARRAYYEQDEEDVATLLLLG